MIPASAGYENMIVIKGHYESGEDKFNYEIWLRPWGTYWDDVEEKSTNLIITTTGICR